MRLNSALLLLLIFSFCQGQNVTDSILRKEWSDVFNSKLHFEQNSHLLFEMPNGSIYKTPFLISDSVIHLRYRSDTSWHEVKYKYFTDSLILYSNRLSYLCWERIKKTGERYVYYSADYLSKKPFAFEKIQISDRNGLSEIDKNGNILYVATNNYEDHYGHYRGKLSDDLLKKFKQIIEVEQFKLRRLSCKTNRSRAPSIKYQTKSQSFVTKQNLDRLQEGGYQTIDFIIQNVSPDKLEFQNYADEDSIEGLMFYQLQYEGSHLFEIQPTYLARYEDGGSKYYFYKGFIDSLYSPDIKFYRIKYANNPIYFYSDTLINTKNNILIEAVDAGEYWFWKGRTFLKPEGMIFKKLLSYRELPPNHKIVVRESRAYNPRWSKVRSNKDQIGNGFFKNPFPKQYKTRFGLPYPFLRPPHQVAFEEYVLPDWEEYIEKGKLKERKD